LVAAPPARADEAAEDLKRLQGEWSIASAQEGGKEQADEQSKKVSIVIHDDVFSFKAEGQPKTLDMKMKLDPKASPKAIDLTSTITEGATSFGIYEMNGDELKVIWSRNAKPRPDAFSTKAGDDRIFLIFKRLKK
jgi:uncharacterized protein (TIGR03067 family)